MVITGGAGFIGSHAAEHFSSRGNEVVVYDNLSRSGMMHERQGGGSYIWSYLHRNYPRINLVNKDVRSFPDVENAVKGAEAIVHTAGQVAMTTSLLDPRSDFETNALGTLNILEAARLHDAAVVFCSTNKVYGENVNKLPVRALEKRYRFDHLSRNASIDENFPIDHTGHGPYGSSKLAADVYVQDYAHTYGLKTGVFRMSCIYGERQFGMVDQGWIAWFVIATLLRKPITIYGDGKQVRDTLYIDDLIDAFDRFLQSNLKHAVLNLGGGPKNTLSLLELLDLLWNITGIKPAASFAEWRHADQKVYISNIRRANEMLGWRPRMAPEQGIKRVVNWVRENRNLFN